MEQDNTLLDLDRVPTLDELREFFKKHDWSAAQISDPISRSIEKNEAMEAIKKVLDAEYEKVAREKGLGSASWYFENEIKNKGEEQQEFIHQGNSLIELRNNTEDLIADAVYEIAENHEEILDIILSQFNMNDPDFEQKADEFLHNAVGTMLDVMEYEKLTKMIHEMSAFEDFNPKIKNNYRAKNHERRWYHTDTKHPTLYKKELSEKDYEEISDAEEEIVAEISVEEYWKSLSETDRKIFKMTIKGYSQVEIAEAVGMANNSGVSKRLAKLKKDFIKKTGLKIE